jgi:pyridoxamine 5'-phosphate oxidase
VTDQPEKTESDDPADWAAVGDPFRLFHEWLNKAKETEINDPNGVALSTADASGFPDVRMVLLKDADERGFVFYTNLGSVKGQELAENPRAALCFHWKSLRRQVRVRGHVTPVTAEEADAYFASRHRESQSGAWASRQSRPLETRFELEKEVARYAAKFGLGKVPRPAHWSGFRIAPVRIEFWRDRPFRLHDRLVFVRPEPEGDWQTMKLFP